MRSRLASLLQSLGCTQSASDIYRELEMWEDLVQCYKSQGKLGQLVIRTIKTTGYVELQF